MLRALRDVMALSEAIRQQIDEAAARVRVGFPGWLRPFLMRDVIAITLGRRVYISPRLLERGTEAVEPIVRHELAHVRQVARLGLLRFLYQYVRDYAALRRGGLSPAEAYRAIPFEMEAKEAEKGA
ncbi:MAG TPA: DUF4157 domain-containing protein [Thermoanaerobaculia bacterium]